MENTDLKLAEDLKAADVVARKAFYSGASYYEIYIHELRRLGILKEYPQPLERKAISDLLFDTTIFTRESCDRLADRICDKFCAAKDTTDELKQLKETIDILTNRLTFLRSKYVAVREIINSLDS